MHSFMIGRNPLMMTQNLDAPPMWGWWKKLKRFVMLYRKTTKDRCLQYDPQTKRQSTEWKNIHSPTTKKDCMQPSMIKMILIAFSSCKGIVHTEFVPEGQMVNQQCLCCSIHHHHPQFCNLKIGLCSMIMQSRVPGTPQNHCWPMHHIPQIYHPVTTSCSPR